MLHDFVHLLTLHGMFPKQRKTTKQTAYVIKAHGKVSGLRLLFCSHHLERLPRLLWDLFSLEGEDKTHTGGFNKCRAEGMVCVRTTVR